MAPLKHAPALRERTPRADCGYRIALEPPSEPMRRAEKIGGRPIEPGKLYAPEAQRRGRIEGRRPQRRAGIARATLRNPQHGSAGFRTCRPSLRLFASPTSLPTSFALFLQDGIPSS